jgi:ribonuclease BN (tRNA processing enzyme)
MATPNHLTLRVLGSNGTYPTPGRPASGYLVSGGATTVLLDVGPGVAMALQDALDPADLDAIVVSHVHPDHCSDLFAVFNLYRYGPAARRGIPVFVPEGAAAHLAAFLRADPGHELFSVFDFRTVRPGDEDRVGALGLSFGAAMHPIPSLVTAVECAGRRLVYTGDTGPGGDVVEMSRGADLLLAEGTYQGEPDPQRWPYHQLASEAGRVAAAAGVARLVVCHVTPTLDPRRSVTEAAAAFRGPVAWAEPGWEATI